MTINTSYTMQENVYNVFRTFIRNVLPEEQVIPFHTLLNAPTGPYTAVKVLMVEEISPHAGYISPVDPDTHVRTVQAQYKGTVNIRSFGDRAFARLHAVIHYLKDPLQRNLFTENGIGALKASPIKDGSMAIDNQTFEERALVTLQFNFVMSSETAEYDVIENVVISPTFN